jgi:hypothetical protein
MQALKTRWRPLLRIVASGLLLGLLLTPVGMAHLDRASDVCERAPLFAIGAGQGLSSASPSDHLHDHCFTCHWFQSFRSTLLVAAVPVPVAAGSCPMLSADAFASETVLGTSVPARAPPLA